MELVFRILICALCFLCCNKTSSSVKAIKGSSSLPILEEYSPSYDFSSPSATYVLDASLEEISSLAYDPADNTFLTNDDESGHFYILNPNDFSISKQSKFSKKGDFEAIEKIDDQIYVAKSNGNIHVYNTITKASEVIKSVLSAKNDVEGLCYDPTTERLLIACKGQPLDETKVDDKSKKKDVKCIYSMDIVARKLDSQPFLEVLDSELTSYVKKHNSILSKSELKKLVHRARNFSPSGIAIHPQSGSYYLISAKSSLVAIYSKSKELLHLAFLNEKTNPQPEGITFDGSNNLFIATEGQGFSGKIFKFQSQ